jgi:hypothetical protein
MASVDLTGLPIAAATPMAVKFGGVQRPATGGAITRIHRMGSRWSFSFVTPEMNIEPDHRLWSAQIDRAQDDGALIEIYQPDLVIGTPGNPIVSAATNAGRSVPLSGLTPAYVIRAGQWVSFVVGGQRYLDRVRQQVTASGTGTATIIINNLLRAPLPINTVAELAVPKIEGSLEMNSASTWGTYGTSSFAFTISEDA